ncbi:MAG: imidazoleglycerol-phosphate dehydratase HisB [Halobacteriaceae archaeon]
MPDRTGAASRSTAETAVDVTLAVDGEGTATVDTGVAFLDHMLEALATHGLFDLTVQADGDLAIDDHHTVEDIGIVLGEAFDEAIGEKRGIERFADRRVPLDEAVASVVVDLSGRPLFRFDGTFSQAEVGELTSEMARHFWRSFATTADITMHASITGRNAHHEIEALFKAAARALDDATRLDSRRGAEPPSTKEDL